MAAAADGIVVEQDDGEEGSASGEGKAQQGPKFHGTKQKESTGRQESQHSKRQTERTLRMMDTRSESIEGLDELSSCINSVDDHFQAGLQELRNCVTNLKKERTKMSEKVYKLTEEIEHLSNDRDCSQAAIAELQQEVSSLREQLCRKQQEKETMIIKMQKMEQRNEDHLASIAGKQRSKRLAHSALVQWRRKALGKGLRCQEQLQLLEEENNQLRAELLLCQEAAKQAFLRSASALNSEAITMFQDAATRRLGFEEGSSQGNPASHSPSPTNSPRSPNYPPPTRNEMTDSSSGNRGDNKENIGDQGGGRNLGMGAQKIDSERQSGVINEGTCDSDDDRSYIATYGCDDQRNLGRQRIRLPSRGIIQRTGLGYGEPSHVYDSDSQPPSGVRHSASFPRPPPPLEEQGAVGGSVPYLQRPQNLSVFNPDALQQETRAYLQQLREERRRRSDSNVMSGLESERKSQKMEAHHEPKRKTCSCRQQRNIVEMQKPYKCPYCTPVQNSSFGHAKDTGIPKKSLNVNRHTIPSSANTDKKRVVYRPSASTVLIEKHITR